MLHICNSLYHFFLKLRWRKCGEEAETITPFTFIVGLLTKNNAIHPNLNNLTNLSVTICQFSQTLFKLIEGQKEKEKLSNSYVYIQLNTKLK